MHIFTKHAKECNGHCSYCIQLKKERYAFEDMVKTTIAWDEVNVVI